MFVYIMPYVRITYVLCISFIVFTTCKIVQELQDQCSEN